jgi:hypothetical protein
MILQEVRLEIGQPHETMLTVDVAQKTLRELKAKISSQSKRNFVLEKDVRYLDSRIALLIQNRLRIEEVGVHKTRSTRQDH